MLFVLYLTTHFNNSHTPKVNGIKTAKLEVYAAHINYTSLSKKNNHDTLSNLSNTKKYFLELLQDKHWFSSTSICSNKQQKDIDTILEQLTFLKKQISTQEYNIASKYNTVFYSLLSNIDHLQTDLNKRYLYLQNTLHYARIFTIFSLLVFIFGVLFISTKRKRVREKLLDEAQKANYFLKEAQKIAKLIIYSYDFKTKHWKASDSYSNIVGADVNANSMQSWIDKIHPEDKARMTNIFDLRIEKPSTKFNETYRIVNATTKKTHWIHHVIQDLQKDKKGNLMPIQGLIQDITQHKLAEEKIRRSNVILNKVNSLVLVLDRKNNITYASEGVKNILGYKTKDILNQGWWKLTFSNSELAQKTKDFNFQYFFNKGSKSKSPDEFSIRRIKTKKGNYKWIKWSFTKESENSFIAIGIDITDSHEKTRRYMALTETAHDAIILSNNKGKIIDINKTAIEMFGYSKKEILDKSVIKLMPLEHQKSFKRELTLANKKDGLKKSEFRVGEGLTKNGLVFPIEISFNSWLDENNQTHFAFIKDISERKHEEKIKKIIYNITKYTQKTRTLNTLLPFIKKSLSSVIDTSDFHVSLYDNDKQIFNSYEKIDLEKVNHFINFPKGKSLFDYVIETKKSLLYTKSSQINGSKIESDTKSKCWIGVPLIVKQKVIGVMSIRSYTDENAYSQKDISLLELVASTISQVIQKSKDFERINLLNQALTQSSAIIVVIDTKGIVEFVNAAFTKKLGYESDEVLGKNYRFIGVENKQLFLSVQKKTKKGKAWEGEFTNTRKDGTHFIVAATVAPVRNDTGEVTHYISVQEDISDRRKLEDQFINGFIEAQEIEKQRFGQELHDGISQILSAEAMYINVLIKENKDRIDNKARYLTKIRELNHNAADETRNIAHGLLSHKLFKTGLIKAIENICVDYSCTKNIEFTYIHENISDDILSKEIQTNLFRIIQEITTNIVRHSKATEASINFNKLKNSNMINLIIKDNGIGFDSDKTKKEIKGIGFDNIKRRIILLNGTLNIETSLNKGVCYAINIPL